MRYHNNGTDNGDNDYIYMIMLLYWIQKLSASYSVTPLFAHLGTEQCRCIINLNLKARSHSIKKNSGWMLIRVNHSRSLIMIRVTGHSKQF